jgi:hypothetical protein
MLKLSSMVPLHLVQWLSDRPWGFCGIEHPSPFAIMMQTFDTLPCFAFQLPDSSQTAGKASRRYLACICFT